MVRDGGLPAPTGLLPIVAAAGLAVLGAAVVGGLLSGTLRRSLSWSPVRPLLLALALVLAVLLLGTYRGEERPEVVDPPPEALAEEAPDDVPDWLPTGPVLLVAVVAMAVGGLVVARFLRRAEALDDGDVDAEPDDGGATGAARRRLVADLDEVIEELRHDPDPRRAVIRAWARLEDLLAGHRLPRRPSEAPTAYVGRVLERLATSGAAVRALTVAFERAMFSAHAIGRPEQAAAVDALLAVREDLGARP